MYTDGSIAAESCMMQGDCKARMELEFIVGEVVIRRSAMRFDRCLAAFGTCRSFLLVAVIN